MAAPPAAAPATAASRAAEPGVAPTPFSSIHDEAAGIKVRAALAVLVDQARVRKLWPTKIIDRRQAAKSQKVHYRGQEVVRVGGATRNRHHGFAEYRRDAR
ncbi:MAG: hypothetical protein KBE22_14930, partial [Candidatus Accumulibacter sp.]|nr:hypothetical protein [Accumulibacter sp.]